LDEGAASGGARHAKLQVGRSVLQRADLEAADVQLEPFGLQQDVAGRRPNGVGAVDLLAIDGHGDRARGTAALDAGPFARRALGVVLAAGVDELLEGGVMAVPPELALGEDAPLATFLPARPLVRAEGDITGELDRNDLALGVLAADDDQVADAALGELAFD